MKNLDKFTDAYHNFTNNTDVRLIKQALKALKGSNYNQDYINNTFQNLKTN